MATSDVDFVLSCGVMPVFQAFVAIPVNRIGKVRSNLYLVLLVVTHDSDR